jgi:hypothetical protein
MKLTRGEIRSKAQVLVGDIAPTGASGLATGPSNLFSDDAYSRFINDAAQECVRLCPYVDLEKTVTTTASTATYAVEGLITIEHVDYDDKPLEWITSDRLDRLDETWQTRTGEPQFVLLGWKNIWNTKDADVSLSQGISPNENNRQFTLYPAPETTGITLRVIGRMMQQPLINDFTAPALPDYVHDAVVFETAALVLEASGDQRNEALAQAYRELRDWYLQIGNDRLVNRYPSQVKARGRTTRIPSGLLYDPHVPFTGIAPGTAE